MLRRCKELKALLMVHAENAALVEDKVGGWVGKEEMAGWVGERERDG